MTILNDKISFLTFLFVLRTSVFKVRRGADISFDAYTIFQIIVVCIIFILLVLSKNPKKSISAKNKPFSLLFSFYLLGILSCIWSALPYYSFYFAFQNMVFLFAFRHMFNRFESFIQAEKAFFIVTFMCIIIDAFGDFIINGYKFFLNWHNLETGGLAGMLLCYSLAEYVINKRRGLLEKNRKTTLLRVIYLSAFVLVFSTSSASNISALCGILSIALVGKNSLLKLFSVFSILLLIVIPNFLLDLIPLIFPGKSIDGIMSFGSRLHIWEPIFELFRVKPVLGWGYGAAERIIDRTQVDSHNTLIGAMGGLGIIGGLVMLLFMIMQLKSTLSRISRKGYFGLFAASVALIVNSNSFGFLSGKTSLLTFGFFMICTLTLRYENITSKFK